MTLYLLDTNVVCDLVRRPGGAVARRIAEVGESAVFTSLVVAAELRFGAAGRASRRLTERVALILSRMDVRTLEAPADAHYAEIRDGFERRGTPIGANDLWIAAHARCLGAVVVTGNQDEFRRVPGLEVEDWLVPEAG